MNKITNHEEYKNLLNNQEESSYFIKAKWKNKYYNCKIIEKGYTKSKVIFIKSGWTCYIDNKNILY